jgi:hypothetical protein
MPELENLNPHPKLEKKFIASRRHLLELRKKLQKKGTKSRQAPDASPAD